MPQMDLLTYGDTAVTSFVVFWVYFISVVLVASRASLVRYFPSFFALSLISPLARLYSRV